MKKYCFWFASTILFACSDEKKPIQNTDNQIVEIQDTRAKLDSSQYVFTVNGIDLNWKMLGVTKYEKEFSQQLGGMVDIPTFPMKIQNLNAYEVSIKGFVIPLEEVGSDSLLILSKNPYTSCFFCGQAGPETVIEIRLKEHKNLDFKLDQKITFKGVFETNQRDFDYLNFILKDAEVVKK